MSSGSFRIPKSGAFSFASTETALSDSDYGFLLCSFDPTSLPPCLPELSSRLVWFPFPTPPSPVSLPSIRLTHSLTRVVPPQRYRNHVGEPLLFGQSPTIEETQ